MSASSTPGAEHELSEHHVSVEAPGRDRGGARFDGTGGNRLFGSRPVAPGSAQRVECRGFVQVAHQGDDDPGRNVPARVVAGHVVATEAFQHRFAADAPASQPVRCKEQFVEGFAGHGVGRIELASRLLDDHAQLATQFVRIEQRIAHLIRLQRDEFARMPRRHGGVVHRPVVRGVRVE